MRQFHFPPPRAHSLKWAPPNNSFERTRPKAARGFAGSAMVARRAAPDPLDGGDHLVREGVRSLGRPIVKSVGRWGTARSSGVLSDRVRTSLLQRRRHQKIFCGSAPSRS